MNKGVTVTSKDAELVYSNRICCYDDEQMDVKIKLTEKKEDELKLRFLFKYTNDAKYKIDITTDAETGIVLKLTNFNSPTGIGLKQPISIGKLNDRTVSLIFSVYKHGDVNPIIDLSVYLEKTNG